MRSPQEPVDGWQGFRQFLAADLSAGFTVFLLALPLSLGIAKASDVPPMAGIVTAIVGGVLVTFFTGCKLSIKGPAAGLIVIVAGAVEAFGGGVLGWKLAAGTMVVAGVVQVLFGVLRLGKVVDFFPLAAIHGMLAAIGLIIIAKQVPVLLNVDPSTYAGMGPFALIGHIPQYLAAMDREVALLGVVCMAIMLFWSRLSYFRGIPGPLVVLLVAIPVSLLQHYNTRPDYTLVEVGSLAESIAVNADMSGMAQTGVFIHYVILFALVGSLESLLTVKSIDIQDPYKRWSNPDRDLIAIGIGNTIAAIVGGIPMISEVARSSANVSSGAVTRWANFWHGCLLLFFVAAAYPLLELIPNTAMAAMLIVVGWRMVHPRHFVEHWSIGKGQLFIFITTIVLTLLTDLLIGVASGIAVNLVLHLIRGARLRDLLRSPVKVSAEDNTVRLELSGAAVFTNYLSLKRSLDTIPDGKQLMMVATPALSIIDHSVMDNIEKFCQDYEQMGGTVTLEGFDSLTAVSDHPLAVRVRRGG